MSPSWPLEALKAQAVCARTYALLPSKHYGSYRFEGRLAGCDEAYGVHVEVRLYRRVKRIELCYSLRRLPERDPSSIYVAFPFALERGRLAFDGAGRPAACGREPDPGLDGLVEHRCRASRRRATARRR